MSGLSASDITGSTILQNALVIAVSLVLNIPASQVGAPVVTSARRRLEAEDESHRRLSSSAVSMTVTSALSSTSVSSSLSSQTGQLSDAVVNQATADGYSGVLSLSVTGVSVVDTSPTFSPTRSPTSLVASSSSKEQLPPGSIAAAVIMSVFGAALIIGGIYYYNTHHTQSKATQPPAKMSPVPTQEPAAPAEVELSASTPTAQATSAV